MPLPDLIRGGDGPIPEGRKRIDTRMKAEPMAEEKKRRTSPAEFINQVRAEASKVVWPTRQETITTSIFVGILVLILSLFFLAVDSAFGALMQWLLRIA